MPFTTRWVGENPDAAVPIILYIVVLLLWTIMFQIMEKIVAGDYPVIRDRVSEYKQISVALCIGLIIAAIIAVFYPSVSMVAVLFVVIMRQVSMFKREKI